MAITEEERKRRKQLYDRRRYLERKAKGEIKKTSPKTARNKATPKNTSRKNSPEPRYKNRSDTYNSKFAREEGSKFVYMNVYVGKDALKQTQPTDTIYGERLEDIMKKLDGIMPK